MFDTAHYIYLGNKQLPTWLPTQIAFLSVKKFAKAILVV